MLFFTISSTITNFSFCNTFKFSKLDFWSPKHPNAKTAISIDYCFYLTKVILMLSKNQLGFLYMFMSVCAFSIMDLIVKWSDSYPLGQVLFFRGFFGLVFYFLIIPRDRLKNFYYTKRAGLHFFKMSIWFNSSYFYIYCFKKFTFSNCC